MIRVQNTYDVVEPLSKYPRSKEKLKGWIRAELDTLQKAMLEQANVKDLKPQELSDEQIEASLTNIFYLNPRDLYEFFDENNFHIEVYKLENDFGFDIGTYSNDKHYQNRFEAEKDAFNTAFEMLEHVM